MHYFSRVLIKIHLEQIILQRAQYAYPYIIKLIHMGKKQQKNIIYNFPKRKRDGVRHTRAKRNVIKKITSWDYSKANKMIKDN
ncbi:UNVERIFIED_CONTAM: hypothetical protein NCL1_33845 [Trichonephila clavipes]